MVNRYSIFDLFVLERWLDSMAERLTRSSASLDAGVVRDVRDELQRAVYELKCQRATAKESV